MRLAQGIVGALVTQEAGDVEQRRAGYGEFPINDRGNNPPPAFATDEHVPVTEVAMNEAGFVLQARDFLNFRPRQPARPRPRPFVQPNTKGRGGEATLNKFRYG